ncbi:MFS transporter, partial [Heyndrickxia sporothermodurans]
MNNTFKLYYISSLVAVIGNAVSQIAVSWYISSMISHAHLAYLIASTFLCTFLFSVLLSPIIDRNNPIRIYRISVVGRIILLIVTIVLLKLLEGSIGPLVLLLIIQSILTVMGSNTSFKIVKYIVPEEKLLKANALLTANSRTGYLIGMFLGGILIKYLNIDTVLIIEVIGYCLSLGLL